MKVTQKIEQFIQDSLRHRYDGRSPQVTFLERKINSVHCVLNLNGSIELVVPPTEPFQAFVYRLPQTRIYYSFYQNSEWRIKILDFFDQAIFLIRSLNGPHTVRFKIQNRQINIQPLTETAKNGNGWQVENHAFRIFTQNTKTPVNGKSDVLPFLHSVREQEYKRHILSSFFTAEPEIQKKIDQLFAGLDFIDSEGNLRPFSITNSPFIWVQELFLQLGWQDRLKKFYEHNKITKNLKASGRVLAVERLNRFLENVGDAPVQLPRKENIENNQTFLLRYLLPESHDVELDLDLQSFWEYLQIPALHFRWEDEIAKKPDEFMAFVLLSIRRKFWWAPMAVDFVKALLPESYKIVFDLLTTILLRIRVSVEAAKMEIGSLCEPKSEYQFVSDFWNVKFYKFGKQPYAHGHFSRSLNLTINLNKYVDFEVDFQSKVVYLKPSVFRPPVKTLSWNTIEIELNNNKIIFPLIWEQATLKLNSCRLKFLRKKNRFQISIKNPDSGSVLRINGKSVEMRNDRYTKFYHSIDKSASESNVQAFSSIGRRLNALVPEEPTFTLRGIAFDVFGIIKDEFRVRFDTQRRNHGIKTNGPKVQILNAPKMPFTLTITGRRCAPIILTLNRGNSFWHAFKEMPAERLINELKIWIEKSSKIDAKALEKTIRERLNWIPETEIVELKNFHPRKEGFNLLISSHIKSGDEKTEQIGFINIFRTSKSPKIKYFQINLENWQNIFDFYFFIQDFAKN